MEVGDAALNAANINFLNGPLAMILKGIVPFE
jgi:hypothetical protein